MSIDDLFTLGILHAVMAIDRHLHELLYEHDCVIVPQWGGFLSQYKSARLEEGHLVVYPPAKEVGFNRHLLRNDGLLADHVAAKDGVDHPTAVAQIGVEVDGWLAALDKDGRVELPRIGVFYRDAERNLQFDPDTRSNFLKESFGLRPLAAVPVAVPKEMPAPRVIPIAEGAPGASPSWVWAAAASVALVFGAAAIWAYLSIDPSEVQWSGIGPWKEPTVPAYVPSSEAPLSLTTHAAVFSLPADPLGVRSVALSANDSVRLTVDLGSPAVAVRDTTRVVTPVNTAVRTRFHVIGGCFAQEENAARLFSDLLAKGYPAVRLSQYGELHPVAFGSYPDRATAIEELGRVRASGTAQAWLLIR